MEEIAPGAADQPPADEWEATRFNDDSVVVRGGVMAMRDLAKSVQKDHDLQREPGLSVSALPEGTIQDVLTARPLVHAQVRVTTFGALRAAGFGLEPTGEYGHADIRCAEGFPLERLEQLEGLFDRPQENPNPPVKDA